MKKTLIFLAGALWLASCTQDATESVEYRSLVQQNDSLRGQIQQRETQVNQVADIVSEIEANLAAIQRAESEISQTSSDQPEDQKERINRMIREIETYSERNQQRIAELETQSSKFRSQSAGLNRLVTQLKESVAQKDAEIVELRQNIEFLSAEVDTLRSGLARNEQELGTRQSRIEEQTEALNTAYYRIGNRRELVEAEIIKREGGVLGINKTSTLNEKLSPSKFSRVDIRELQEIELGGKKRREVISAHPEGSYSITERDGRAYLQIQDQEAFWSVSKFLVVEVDS